MLKLRAAPCLGHTFRNTVFHTRAENIKVSSNWSSRSKQTAFFPLNYRQHITLVPVFCCFLPLLNPLKLLHTCSHCFSEHLCCIFTLPGTLQCEKNRSWLGCLGEQHQPLSIFCMALWQLSFKQSVQSQTLRQILLFKHLLNILWDWRLKLGQKKASKHLQNSLVQHFSDISLPSS